jgi:hypothetical protein
VRSIKEECLNHVIPLGERHFRRTLAEFMVHYHRERNHQGFGNDLIDGVGDPILAAPSGGVSASVAFSATTIVRRSRNRGSQPVGQIVGHYGTDVGRTSE